jgi:hypothetical protein
VDLHEVVLASPAAQLTHGLNEGHALDVADRATKLYYAHVWLLARVVYRYPRNPLDPFLDRIGDVWNDLHGLAKIVSASLALNDLLVDLASCNVVVAGEGDVEVALVVAEVEVDFAAIREDKNFAMPVTE